MTGPRWIKQWINNLAALNELFRDDDGKVDFEALGREEYQFRQALVTHKFAKSERAKEAYQQAMTAYSANVENGKKGGRPKKSPQDAPNGNAPDASGNGLEEYHDQETASGNYQEPDKVSTNNGDAARREAADGDTDGNVAVARTTTVSNPLALDMPKTDKASNPRGYNTADVPPSYGPENGTNAAQPESPANDQSDRHKRGREEPATDADIRKDSENMPDAGNGGTLESGTSAAGDSFEARERPSPGEGRKTFATGSSHPVANPPPPFVLKHLQKCGKQKQKANAQSPPRSSEDVRLFAIDKHLDVDDARMWYQMNFVDRPGCDKDGVAINNWKGHCTAYCKAEAERRKAG